MFSQSPKVAYDKHGLEGVFDVAFFETLLYLKDINMVGEELETC
jgi:hypothetical protein